MKRLVIIEDQTAIREMLVEILRTDPNYKLVGESGDGQSALALCLEVKPDLLVLDAKLPGLNGVDLLRRLSKRSQGGKPLKKSLVAIYNHGDTGLLEHDFGDPDGVGIGVAPPRQIPPIARIPLQQLVAEPDDLFGFPVLPGHEHT